MLALKITDIEIGKRQGKMTVRSGKVMKFREVPLPSETRQALKEWLDKHPRVGNGFMLARALSFQVGPFRRCSKSMLTRRGSHRKLSTPMLCDTHSLR
jgi:integrase